MSWWNADPPWNRSFYDPEKRKTAGVLRWSLLVLWSERRFLIPVLSLILGYLVAVKYFDV